VPNLRVQVEVQEGMTAYEWRHDPDQRYRDRLKGPARWNGRMQTDVRREACDGQDGHEGRASPPPANVGRRSFVQVPCISTRPLPPRWRHRRQRWNDGRVDTGVVMNGSLAGRTAIVTGGSRGLGLAMAEALGRQGADLVLVDLLDAVTEAAERLDEQLPASVIAQLCDVTNAEQVTELLERAVGELGTPTILVNAAGVASNEPALTVSADQWRRVLDVNVTGTFLPCQAFARKVVDAGQKGSIVNIASMSGLVVNVPQPQAAYNASKAAVSMLTASLAVEWLPLGIRVNAIAPGYFASDMTKAVAGEQPEMLAEWMRRTPAGRMGRPEELGPLVTYLCGEQSDFVVGQTIVIDGGYTIV
jgi:NAD(P)-dependent dehydrogenase (short-subunit alcohol dehydrogenase family)